VRAKILPSPISPVLAARVMVSTIFSALSFRDDDLDLELRHEAHGIFDAAGRLGAALLATVSLDLCEGQQCASAPAKPTLPLFERPIIRFSPDRAVPSSPLEPLKI
jgi:hypothetical protein